MTPPTATGRQAAPVGAQTGSSGLAATGSYSNPHAGGCATGSGPTEHDEGTAPGVVTATRVEIPLGRRVMVVGDLLLPAEATPSSLALAADVALTLDRWQGPGTVIVCGNLFAGTGSDSHSGADRIHAALASHRHLAEAIRTFTGRADCRLLLLPGWRDPEVACDPAVATELYALGVEIAPSVDLRLATAAGERRVLVRAGCPAEGASSTAATDSADAAAAHERPWMAGIDRLEDPGTSSRFVSSRTLYRRLGRFVWVPPMLAVLAALIIRLTVVFHGVYHLVRRVSGPRRILVRAYSASWPSRLLFTLVVIMILEVILAVIVAVLSRRAWKAYAGDDLPMPWAPPPWPGQSWAGRPGSGRPDSESGGPSPSSSLLVGGAGALDEARILVSGGATGMVTGGALRAELTHLGPGFFACPGGTTELLREHPGRMGFPPVFLRHRQASWIELETGADLHVRLLLADVDIPDSNALERLATGYRVVKGYMPVADLHPAVVASWPLGASWPPAPEVAADRVRVRRVRRLAAGAIFLAGLFDLLAAVSRPAAGDLHLIQEYLPLGVAQAAGALVALAGIGLIMLARGILRGQHRAWLVATALLATTLALHLVHGAHFGDLVLTVLVLLLLLAERDLFGAAADQASAWSAAFTLVIGGVMTVGAALLAIEVSGRVIRHPLPSWPHVLLAATEGLVGLHAVVLPDPIEDWAFPSLLAVGVGLALVALYLLTRPVVDRRLSSGRASSTSIRAGEVTAGEVTAGEVTAGEVTAGEVTAGEVTAGRAAPIRAVSARRAADIRARDIVRRHGTGTLDYFALRDDKQWFFHRDSLVAYAVYGGVCLVSPDPIGPQGERYHVWDAFRHYCDRRGWAVAVIAASEDWLPLYRDAGMRHVYIGDEAVVDVQRFSLQGGTMKGLRQAVNRVERHGYTARFLDPSKITPEVGRPLVELMRRNRRGDEERGFSMMLGRMFDPRDTGLLLTAVYGADGEPAAMCQFVPSAAIRGFSLDLMRRDPGDHPNGLLDFALCSTIEHLRRRGQHGLSLNFAAMRSTLEGESGDGLTQRVERWALRRMSGVLQIESLWRFNAKYEPGWLPRYVVYDSLEQLAPALVSILRAESMSDVPVVGRFLVPSANRRSGPVLPETVSGPGQPETPAFRQ